MKYIMVISRFLLPFTNEHRAYRTVEVPICLTLGTEDMFVISSSKCVSSLVIRFEHCQHVISCFFPFPLLFLIVIGESVCVSVWLCASVIYAHKTMPFMKRKEEEIILDEPRP